MFLNFGCHLPWAEIWNTAFSFIICEDDDAAASSLMEFYVPAHLTNLPEFHSYTGFFKNIKIIEKGNFVQKLLSSRLKISVIQHEIVGNTALSPQIYFLG